MKTINEKIPVIHEMRKKLGAWDGLPYLAVVEKDEFYADDQAKMHAYLAQKLDEITWAICDAMRARADEIEFQDSHRARKALEDTSSPKWHGNMKMLWVGTYEYYLTRALLLTLDLMGFYNYSIRDNPLKSESNNCNLLANYAIHSTSEIAVSIIKSIHVYSTDFIGVIMKIFRIAELDKIDLDWHLDALVKYMKGVK